MVQNNIPPPPPGFEIVGAGVPLPPAASPSPAASPRPSASRYSGPMPTSADEVFASLIAQESGGRTGVRGPDTKYGNALGRTQVLPDTARGIAKNLGIPYREDLLTGMTPEAAAYQDQLGRAYLQEGFQNTGNARDAMMYYHGGPDRALWGPKTNTYADEVLSRWNEGGGIAPVDGAQTAGGYATPPSGFEIEDPDRKAPYGLAGLVSGENTYVDPNAPGKSRANPIDLRDRNQAILAKKGDWVRLENGDLTHAAADAIEGQKGERQGESGAYAYAPNLADAIGAGALAASEQIPFLDESAAWTTGLVTGEGYEAMRERQEALRTVDNQAQRGARIAGGIGGAATGLLLPGSKFIGRGGNLAGRSVRAMGVGAGYGAAYGAGASDGGIGDRVQGATVGAISGGILGAATPAVGQVASSATNFVTRPLGRAANWLTGGKISALERFSPEAQATTRISEALRNDGVSQDAIRAAIDEIQATGVNPSMIMVVQRVAPGGEAARLIRGSAMQQGPASVAAERNLERVSGNIQDQAIDLTRQLTPGEARTPQQVIEDLTSRRGNLARTEYAAPYATRVDLPEGVMAALADDPGAAAIRRARAAAVARQDASQVSDLDAILSRIKSTQPIEAPVNVSAGALDRVQRAIGGRARKMEMSPDTRDIAAGLYGRQGALNAFLEEVPGLSQARGTYRDLTRQAEAVEAGQRGLSAAPDAFSFDELTRPSAAVGYRGALEQAIGAPTESATGTLNRIATSTNQTRNLNEVFGEGAERYQSGLINLMDELKAARFIASSSGSQTAPRLADSALAGIASFPTTVKAGLVSLIEKAARGATLTRAERQAIVELGVSEAQLRDISRIPFVSQYLVAPASAGAGQIAAP